MAISNPLAVVGKSLLTSATTCLVVTTVACTSVSQETQAPPLGAYIEASLAELQVGNHERAASVAEEALTRHEGNQRLELILIRANLMRGTRASVDYALHVLGNHPNRTDYRWQSAYGAALERKGLLLTQAVNGSQAAPPRGAVEHWRRAHRRYEQALQLRSGEAEVLRSLMRTSILLGDEQAEVRWRHELDEHLIENGGPVQSLSYESTLEPKRTATEREQLYARLDEAEFARRLGNPEAAVRQVNELISTKPAFAPAHAFRGQLLMDMGQFADARGSLQRYLDLIDLPIGVDNSRVRYIASLRDECALEMERIE